MKKNNGTTLGLIFIIPIFVGFYITKSSMPEFKIKVTEFPRKELSADLSSERYSGLINLDSILRTLKLLNTNNNIYTVSEINDSLLISLNSVNLEKDFGDIFNNGASVTNNKLGFPIITRNEIQCVYMSYDALYSMLNRRYKVIKE